MSDAYEAAIAKLIAAHELMPAIVRRADTACKCGESSPIVYDTAWYSEHLAERVAAVAARISEQAAEVLIEQNRELERRVARVSQRASEGMFEMVRNAQAGAVRLAAAEAFHAAHKANIQTHSAPEALLYVENRFETIATRLENRTEGEQAFDEG